MASDCALCFVIALGISLVACFVELCRRGGAGVEPPSAEHG